MFRQRIAGGNGAASPLVLSVTVAVEKGETILMAVTTGSSVNVSSVSDTKSNTWTIDVPSSFGTPGGRRVAIVRSSLTVSLTTSDTISITLSGAASVQAAAFEYAGILTSSPLDKSNGAFVSGTSLATGTTGTLSQLSEIIFTTVGSSVSPTFTSPGGYNERSTGQSSIDVADLTVYDTTAVNPSWSWSGGASNTAVAVATYKRQADLMFL